jgi:hypothetical protein
VHGSNVEITAISEICEVSVRVYFVTQGQITQPSTALVGHVTAEINIFL